MVAVVCAYRVDHFTLRASCAMLPKDQIVGNSTGFIYSTQPPGFNSSP